MKAPLFIVIVVLALALLAMGAAGPASDPEDSVARLRERIDMLERRIENLEEKLPSAKHESRSAVRRSVRRPRGQSAPPGWRRREFNGVPYYVIPLEENSRESTRRRR